MGKRTATVIEKRDGLEVLLIDQSLRRRHFHFQSDLLVATKVT